MEQRIMKPIITEKSMTAVTKGWYTFKVPLLISKALIKENVKKQYGVDAIVVRTIHIHGKMRKSGRAVKPTKTMDWKKALVRVKTGQTIDAFQTGKEQSAK